MSAVALPPAALPDTSTTFGAVRQRMRVLIDQAMHARYGAPPPEPGDEATDPDEAAIAIALICAAHF
jgi:hypothetical protein